MSMLPNHYKEERPWGWFERFTLNEPTTVKFLRVEAGEQLSLQRHKKREEYWRVIEGSGIAHVNDEDRDITVGDTIEVSLGSTHRLSGGPSGITVLEIALGEFDENDIERLDDVYGRT